MRCIAYNKNPNSNTYLKYDLSSQTQRTSVMLTGGMLTGGCKFVSCAWAVDRLGGKRGPGSFKRRPSIQSSVSGRSQSSFRSITSGTSGSSMRGSLRRMIAREGGEERCASPTTPMMCPLLVVLVHLVDCNVCEVTYVGRSFTGRVSFWCWGGGG